MEGSLSSMGGHTCETGSEGSVSLYVKGRKKVLNLTPHVKLRTACGQAGTWGSPQRIGTDCEVVSISVALPML